MQLHSLAFRYYPIRILVHLRTRADKDNIDQSRWDTPWTKDGLHIYLGSPTSLSSRSALSTTYNLREYINLTEHPLFTSKMDDLEKLGADSKPHILISDDQLPRTNSRDGTHRNSGGFRRRSISKDPHHADDEITPVPNSATVPIEFRTL